MANLLLSAFIALSLHNAKIDTDKTDYEIMGGFDSTVCEVEVKSERENGNYYKGIKVLTKETNTETLILDRISGELNINEAARINKQYIYKTLLEIKPVKLRFTNGWTHWKDYRLMVGCDLNIKNDTTAFRFQYDTNFYDRHTTRLSLKTKVKYGKYYLQPRCIYNIFEYRQEWELVTELGYKFN